MTRRPAPPHWLLLRAGATIGLHASQEEVRAAVLARPREEWATYSYRDCHCPEPERHEWAMAAEEKRT